MGVLLQIRNVPEETRRVLKERAAARGMSLNAYLLRLLEDEVATPTADELFERASLLPRPARSSSADAIRAERDAREAGFER